MITLLLVHHGLDSIDFRDGGTGLYLVLRSETVQVLDGLLAAPLGDEISWGFCSSQLNVVRPSICKVTNPDRMGP